MWSDFFVYPPDILDLTGNARKVAESAGEEE
jgi:hypothetical protein